MERGTGVVVTEKGTGRANDRLARRRNVSFALALVCFAVSSMFIFGYDGTMVWLMWRDAPVVSSVLVVAGLFFAVRWWRTPRS